jgi:hypothetical protein
VHDRFAAPLFVSRMSLARESCRLQIRMVRRQEPGGCSDFGNWEKAVHRIDREGRLSFDLFQHPIVELFSSPVGGSLDEGQYHGMGSFLRGRQLRLE